MARLLEILGSIADTETTAYLLEQDFVLFGLAAIALLGLLSGAIGPFIVMRQMSFSVHGASELALTGAAAALLFGLNLGLGAIVGSVIAALMFGLMGSRASQRDSSIGVVLAFGLGLAVLFIHLCPGRSGTSFSLLTGQIVGVSEHGLVQMAVVAAIIVGALIVMYRPLVFSSADPEVAEARGVPVRAINMVFAVAAAAVTSSPLRAIGLTILFAEIAAVGGMLLSLAPGVPVSVFVTTISFVIYLACRAVAAVRR